MRPIPQWWVCACLAVVLGLSVVAGKEAAAGSDVVVLDESNFDQLTAQGDWLLEFYAPWCGHCKNLAPTWEDLARQAKAKGLNVGKVDCTENKELATRFGVRGFPTIQFLKDKQLYAYKGQRKVADFLKFALEDGYKAVDPVPLAPPNTDEVDTETKEAADSVGVVHILTSDNFTLATNGGKWFVKFYAPWCGHCKNLAPTWAEAAAQLSGKAKFAKVDCTTESLICQMFEVKGYPTLKFFRGDGRVREYTGVREVADFADFVKKTWKQAAAKPYPMPTFLMHPLVFKFYKVLEPVAEWINANVGYSFAIIAAISLVLGFLIGRLSSGPEVRYVIPKELAPQWNKLLEERKAREEKKQAKKEKKTKPQESPQEQTSASSSSASGTVVPDSPAKKKRRKAKKASPEQADQ